MSQTRDTEATPLLSKKMKTPSSPDFKTIWDIHGIGKDIGKKEGIIVSFFDEKSKRELKTTSNAFYAKPIKLIEYKFKYAKIAFDKVSLLAGLNFCCGSGQCSAGHLSEHDYYKNWKKVARMGSYPDLICNDLFCDPTGGAKDIVTACICIPCLLIAAAPPIVCSVTSCTFRITDVFIVRPTAAACGFFAGTLKDIYLNVKSSNDDSFTLSAPKRQQMI